MDSEEFDSKGSVTIDLIFKQEIRNAPDAEFRIISECRLLVLL